MDYISPVFPENPIKLFPDLNRYMGYNADHRHDNYGRTDIYEKDNELHYDIELPGLERDNITADIQQGMLIVKGESRSDESSKEKNYWRRERRYGTFEKTYRLPREHIDISKFKAKFNTGVLHISFPLKETLESETINIPID